MVSWSFTISFTKACVRLWKVDHPPGVPLQPCFWSCLSCFPPTPAGGCFEQVGVCPCSGPFGKQQFKKNTAVYLPTLSSLLWTLPSTSLCSPNVVRMPLGASLRLPEGTHDLPGWGLGSFQSLLSPWITIMDTLPAGHTFPSLAWAQS